MQIKKQQLELDLEQQTDQDMLFQDMEQQTGSKLGKEYVRLYIVTVLI